MHCAHFSLQSGIFLIFKLIPSINGFALDLIFVTEFYFKMALHSDLVTALCEFSKGHDLFLLSLIVTSLIAHTRRHQQVNSHQSLLHSAFKASFQTAQNTRELICTPKSMALKHIKYFHKHTALWYPIKLTEKISFSGVLPLVCNVCVEHLRDYVYFC